MLYLIGLGLTEKSINLETLDLCRKADKIYIENYTVDFPYKKQDMEKVIKKKIIEADRGLVESESIAEEAKKKDIALLVYGSPLSATTHISLILRCKKEKIKYKIVHNASIFDAIAETGLQLYKFGKITSIPKWQKNYKPNSFIEIVKENLSINSHTLLLVDIGLEFKDLIIQLEESNFLKIFKEKIIVCSCLGDEKSKIYFEDLKELSKKKISKPYCLILPSKMHFSEKEFLDAIREK
jgi:diphthine synthase